MISLRFHQRLLESVEGGGRADRIKQKSIDIDLFAEFLLDIPGIKFVSLQYGDVVSDVDFCLEGCQYHT